jgi:hypothetical protein
VVRSFSKEVKLSRVPRGDNCLKIITPTTSCSRALTNPATVPELSAQLSLLLPPHSSAATGRSTSTPLAPSGATRRAEAARARRGGTPNPRFWQQPIFETGGRQLKRYSRNSEAVPANLKANHPRPLAAASVAPARAGGGGKRRTDQGGSEGVLKTRACRAQNCRICPRTMAVSCFSVAVGDRPSDRQEAGAERNALTRQRGSPGNRDDGTYEYGGRADLERRTPRCCVLRGPGPWARLCALRCQPIQFMSAVAEKPRSNWWSTSSSRIFFYYGSKTMFYSLRPRMFITRLNFSKFY